MQSRRYPINLSARMAVCDANYIRVMKLIPEISANKCRMFVLPLYSSACNAQVSLTVEENFRYTTTIAIRLSTDGSAGSWFTPPSMLVRMYHDACTAEVTSYQGMATATLEEQAILSPAFAMNEKEEVNLLLAEWLNLCLQQGMENVTFTWLEDPGHDQVTCTQET